MSIYTTQSASLTAVADAIRAKTYSSSPLVYPDGFVAAINGIVPAKVITGATVCWNQLIRDGNFPDDATQWTAQSPATFTISGNMITIHRDSSTGQVASINSVSGSRPQAVSGHKYLFRWTAHTVDGVFQIIPTGSTTGGFSGYKSYPDRATDSWIWDCQADASLYLTLRGYTGSGVTSEINVTVENYMCIDLTQLAGRDFADAIYTLEQATPGAGTALINQLFPSDYYAYNTGELVNVNALQDFSINAPGTVLRGLLKFQVDFVYRYGDRIYNDITTRRFEEIDMGSLTWYWSEARFYFYAYLYLGKVLHTGDTAVTMVSDLYPNYGILMPESDWTHMPYGYIYQIKPSSGMSGYSQVIVKYQATSDPAVFTAAVTGKKLTYERVAPY